MLHEKIKQATAHLHDQLEQKMFVNQIMDGSLTFEQYQFILHVNYIIHAFAEEPLFNALSDDLKQKLNLKSRIKLPALTLDLKDADISTTGNGSPYNIDLTSDAAILGSMYVLEGATLGGNVIVKRLKTNEHLLPHHLNYYYYQVYGDKLGEKWKQFLGVLNAIPEAEHQAAVDSAAKLFERMAGFNYHTKSVTVRLIPPPPVGLS